MTPTSKTTPTSGINQPIVFFGTEDFSLYSLSALVEAGYPVVAIVTKPDSRRGRGRQMVEPVVKIYATEHDIPVFQPTKLAEITDFVESLENPVGVLVSFGKIIPESIIKLFTPGIINVHPSLLPKYRGPSPIEAAIIGRDNETGISIMALTREMDAGPVYYQQTVALNQTETKTELYYKLGQLGAKLLVDKLPQILDGSLQPLPQNHSLASYCRILTKADSYLDPTTHSASELEAQVRSHLGYPKSRLTIGSLELIITAAHVTDMSSSPLDITCIDSQVLAIDRLIAPSGKEMPSTDFLRGYRDQLI